jgi:hypothetical protein
VAIDRSNVVCATQLSCLASTYVKLGQYVDAWRKIGGALTAIETSKETWFEAEANRMAGAVALRSPQSDATKAEDCFEVDGARSAGKVLGTPRDHEHGSALTRSGQTR